ncbi:MAG: hypothetical protein OXC95_08785 [Dehalococcoidia bacterium]|nr:hypothetical protein [Dehalococcoidia bacterium]
MTQTVRDSNGKVLRRNVRPEGEGWGVTVWMGGINGLGTDEMRFIYQSRDAARRGDISDEIGKRGRIG